jgi:hypothetical protein
VEGSSTAMDGKVAALSGEDARATCSGGVGLCVDGVFGERGLFMVGLEDGVVVLLVGFMSDVVTSDGFDR